MLKSFLKLFVIASVVLSANANADYYSSGSVYGSNETMRASNVDVAQVVEMRRVQIVNQNQGMVGQYALPAFGGVLGGVIGNAIGNNNTTRTIATVVLTAAGGMAGNAANEYMQKQAGIEYILRRDNGQHFAVTQPEDAQSSRIGVGDTVRLVQGANLRVVKIGTY